MPQNRKFQDFVENKYMADDAIGNNETDKNQSKMLAFLYDGSSLTTGAKTLVDATDGSSALTIPANAILKAFYIDVIAPFESSGSATIALGITGSANALVGATAFDNGAMVAATAGWEMAALGVKTDAAKSVLLTIGGAALTAGSAVIYVEYIETV